MYELHYWNNCRDCGYVHESSDLNELIEEMGELRKQDEANCKYLRDYYAQMWIENTDGVELVPLEQVANYGELCPNE